MTAYRFATDSEVGTIEAATFKDACDKLDAMIGDVDGAWGWVADTNDDRYGINNN